MTNRTKRIVLASLAPAALQLLTVIGAILFYAGETSGDQSIAFVAVLLAGVILSAFILGGDSFDRFWKVHLFSCTASAFPMTALSALLGVIKGTQGYFWLGVTIMIFLVVIVTLLSLPVTYLVYTRAHRSNGSARR